MSFFAPKQNIKQQSEKINKFQATKCEFGSALPVAYGTCQLSPNTINYQDFTSVKNKKKIRTGKNSSTTTISYQYWVYVELALSEGVIDGIEAIEVGDKVYESLAKLNEKAKRQGAGLSLNKGDNPNPTEYMQTKHEDIACGYENMAYLYGKIFLGTDTASMPSYLVTVNGKLRNTGDGKDANPADVILDMLKTIGLDDYIDIDSLNNYRQYCKANDLLISTPAGAFDEQKKCQEYIAELLKITNAYMFWSVDRFKIIPRDDRSVKGWQPNRTIVYSLDENDFISNNGVSVTFSRKDSSEQYNRFGVSFTNRDNSYEQETVFFEDVEDMMLHGVRQAPTLDASWLHTKERAIKVAEMQARINKYEIIKYTFKLSSAYNRLEPADLLLITDNNLGLIRQPCMVDEIKEDEKGNITVTALRRADGVYSAPQYQVGEFRYNSVDFNIPSGNTAAPIIIQPPKSLIKSSTGLELWIALHGEQDTWGGCNIYVSNQDGEYTNLGIQNQSSTFGYITSDIDKDSTELTFTATNPEAIEISTGSVWDADNNNTLVWVDGEFMSYEFAELLDINTYRLTGLRRGQYDTEAVEHKANVTIAICDGEMYSIEVPRYYADKTMYMKFPAFNYLNDNLQDLEDLPYYNAEASGIVKPPKDVEMLDTELLSNGVRRFWWSYDYGKTHDTAGFEIRYVQGNYPAWENGIQLHTGLLTSQPFETDALRQGVHTIMIKAIDTLGNESEKATFAVLDLGEPLEDNILYKKSLKANNWAAVSHNGIIKDGKLHQRDINNFWSNRTDAFWKAADNPMWVGKFEDINIEWQDTAIASGQMWFTYDVQGRFRLEYRVVTESVPFDEEAENSMWKPYTCKVEVKAGDIIQARAFTGASGEATIISDIVMVIDVPDRQEHFEDILISAAGTELPIKTPNYETTAIHIDAVNSDIDGQYELNIISYKPCIIRFDKVNNDAFGTRTPIDVKADITWQGFIKELL